MADTVIHDNTKYKEFGLGELDLSSRVKTLEEVTDENAKTNRSIETEIDMTSRIVADLDNCVKDLQKENIERYVQIQNLKFSVALMLASEIVMGALLVISFFG